MMPLQPALSLSDHTLASGEARGVIATRFGEVVFDTRNALQFPKGLLGMPNCTRFMLSAFPGERMQQFRLLQCADDAALSFITLPLPLDNPIVRREDILAACQEMGIAERDVVPLLIVCVHRSPAGTRLSVNARAPVMIDAARKVGGQHVFLQDRYSVQHFIS